jgi:hypothetical protein
MADFGVDSLCDTHLLKPLMTRADSHFLRRRAHLW